MLRMTLFVVGVVTYIMYVGYHHVTHTEEKARDVDFILFALLF